MILQRFEHSRFSKVLRRWAGETVVLLGGGPSLTFGQVETVRDAHEDKRVRCIAVNDSYLWAPWADVLYAADAHWWDWHINGIPKSLLGLTAGDVSRLMAEFVGEKCTIENPSATVSCDVHMLRNKSYPHHSNGLSLNPQALVTGRNSGFQALNLAVLAGATRIMLLGFDGAPSKTGAHHWFGEHPRPTPPAAYPYYIQAMSASESELVAAGVQVLNCSPGSAINSFPKMSLDEALRCA